MPLPWQIKRRYLRCWICGRHFAVANKSMGWWNNRQLYCPYECCSEWCFDVLKKGMLLWLHLQKAEGRILDRFQRCSTTHSLSQACLGLESERLRRLHYQILCSEEQMRQLHERSPVSLPSRAELDSWNYRRRTLKVRAFSTNENRP